MHTSASSLLVASVVLATAFAATANAPAPMPLELGAPGAYTGPSALPDPEMRLWADDAHHQCGKYALVFRNKDLREDTNDFVHAQGQFFIQFQAVGKGSSEITRFSFSFGATADLLHNDNSGLLNCNKNIPPTAAGQGTAGVYLLYYRSDFNAKDGFFVPIQTRNVPDGDYGAAVHAYSGQCNPVGPTCVEVARAWARAKVDNCPTDIAMGVSAPRCALDAGSDIIKKDHTLPWAMILPGDGEQTNKENGQVIKGLTVEFPEPMINSTVEVFLNGEQLTMLPWRPPDRDTDLMPLNDDTECPKTPVTAGIAYLCERTQYGPGWKWVGDVNKGDVLRVRGQDQNYNLLERTIHVGAATSGGTVEFLDPDLTLEVLNDDDAFIRPGDTHEFNVRVTNIGGGEGHVNLLSNVTTESGRPVNESGLEVYWMDLEGSKTQHVVIPAGGEVTLKLVTKTIPSTPVDHYFVEGITEYDSGGIQQYKAADVIVDVNPEASGNHQHLHGIGLNQPTNTTSEAAPLAKGGADSPGPGLTFALAAVVGALAAALWRRRRA